MRQLLKIEYPLGTAAFPPDALPLITEVALATVTEAREHLPDLPSRLVLLVYAGTNVIPETGIGSAAIAPSVIACTFDPAHHAGVTGVVMKELRPTLLHELHHIARGFVMYSGRPATTFMDFVVSEGLATAFERDVGGHLAPWGNYPDNVREWVKELLSLPISASYRDWMFQHPDGRRWIGYRAGTYLADRAMAALGMSAGELARIDTGEVLRLAGFHP